MARRSSGIGSVRNPPPGSNNRRTRASSLSGLSSLLRTISDSTLASGNMDRKLYGALRDCLSDIGSTVLVARAGRRDQMLKVVSPDAPLELRDDPRLQQVIAEVFEKHALNTVDVQEITHNKRSCDVLIVSTQSEYANEHDGASRHREFCAFVLDPKRFVRESGQDFARRLSKDLTTLATAIGMALRHREDTLANYPLPASATYWDLHSTRDADASRSAPLHPPHDRDKRGREVTATLSFDLRKSTFAMDRAVEPSKFAHWTKEFLLILKTIAHDNLGIFDKFTGDGVMVHFLELECQRFAVDTLVEAGLIRTGAGPAHLRNGTYAAAHAAKCGWEMLDAVEHHMGRLKQIVSLNHSKFGPAAGIAVDYA